MFKINPYRPGAGLMPGYIAGREKDITNIEQIFDALIMNIPVQSVIFSGLRGVGKTVLINKLESIAEEKKIFCKHIEIEERNDFISQIAECSQAFLRKVSTIEKFKHLIQKPLDAIKSLIISFNPNDNTFSVSMQERELYTSGNLTQSLTEVFVSIGELGAKTGTPICFFLIKGYPFFIQQLCQIVYNKMNDHLIDKELVDSSINDFFSILDVGFFKTRYERCSQSDKRFLFAMVKCGELPCTISNVAKNLHKNVNSISTIRAQLINKGIIYPIRYKELDFTVPEFDGFIRRLSEYKQWCKEDYKDV